MADTSNLSNYLKDVADAIRAKKGTADAIPAANFDTEIASITTSENLDDVLQEQTELINELEEILKTKSKTPVAINVFMQETEPENKNGIWVKTDTQYENKIAVQNALSETGEYTKLKNIPYNFSDGSAVAVGTDIYLLGGYNNRTYNYKYDTLTSTYTKMKDIPYDFYDSSAVAVGTDIYLLGHYKSTDNYKYDTLTNTYTKMANIPYDFSNGSVVVIGTDIYLLGGNLYSYNNNYKYDTLTNTYKNLANIPYKFLDGSAVAVGTDIYLLGAFDSDNRDYNYKYDTLIGDYTKMANIPYNFNNGSAVVVGTNIYLLGGSASKTNNYVYNPSTNTYTKLTNIPYDFSSGSAVAVGTDIYLFGGTSSTIYNYKFTLSLQSDIPNNSLVFEQGGMMYKTILFDSDFTNGIEYKFTDVWLKDTNGNIDTTTPVYYGTGTEWVKFKN